MSYESPIQVIAEEVELQMEDHIVKAVQKYDISVNKTELHKALMYDRKQYTQGFEDGKKYAEAEPVRHGRWVKVDEDSIEEHNVYKCSECGELYDWFDVPEHKYCRHCGAKMDGGDL